MKKILVSFILCITLVCGSTISAQALVDAGQGKDEIYDSISWEEIVNGTHVSITIPKPTLTLKVGQKGSYEVLCKSQDVKFAWSSNQTRIATVDASGVITAKGVGKTEIFVTVGKSRYTCYLTVTAAKPKSVRFNKNSFTYNGKVQKPSVIVCGVDGKTLKTSDYTVTYSFGSKNVGNYHVTVRMKGNYTGSYTYSYRILPKATSIKKMTAGKKKFTVSWTAKKTQTDGYQVQYSLKKNMSDAKSSYAKKATRNLLTISKLKAKKTYYVRVRTYKTVKSGKKNVKLYSGWSGIRKIKTK